MTPLELAERIYNHVNSLQRHGESWDKWDDKREIDFIRSLIDNNFTSSQTEISEHRFTEKDIRFAYMQGYNRGVDGNPNHMESYIEQLKKKQ